MPSSRSSGRIQQPAQRRPRTEKACNFCRVARQRCEPIEYGTNDRPCRRCVSQGLDCNLTRTARSQSPSSILGVQGSPIQHRATLQPTSGATEELTPNSETSFQYMLPQSESTQVSTKSWFPLAAGSEGEQGESPTNLVPGQLPLQTPNFVPRASSMEEYQQSFSNVARGCTDPEYYSESYYGQTISSHPYMLGYTTGTEASGPSNLGYATEEPQFHTAGAFVDEQGVTLSCPNDQPHNTGPFSDEQRASLRRPDES